MDKNRPWGVHTIHDICGHPSVSAGLPDGHWVRAIPEPYTGNRLVVAWWVLAGRAFAIIWPKHGELEAALGRKEAKPDSQNSLARNTRVQSRYDELMLAGKHGHYETIFQVVREEVTRASLQPSQ